jgi:hypothetical protein
VAAVLAALGLVGSPAEPVAAQTRVVVPIVIPAPRPAAPRASAPTSVHVTTRTRSPQPGVTSTRVTVQDTSGAGRNLGASPTAPTLTTVPAATSSLQVTTRTASPQPGVTATRIMVRDPSRAGRDLGVSPTARMLTTVPLGTPSTLVTVESPVGPDGTPAAGRTRVIVDDVTAAGRVLGSSPPASSLRTAGPGRQTWTITSDEPIDTPIVILGQ